MTDLTKRYKDYDKRIQEVVNMLTKDIDIAENYIPQLDLLCVNYKIFYEALDDINKNGFTLDGANNNKKIKNPSVQALYSSLAYIDRILNSFPGNPMSKAKLKKMSTMDDELSPLEEFLTNA